MRRATHPWRNAGAWIYDRRVDGFLIHNPAPGAAIADLANFPAQPCGRTPSWRSISAWFQPLHSSAGLRFWSWATVNASYSGLQ